MLIFYGEESLAQRPTPKLEDHPLLPCETDYSIYLQLVCISTDRPLSLQPEDAVY